LGSRARELAHAVALNYVIIVDAAHQLSELGNAPGVMSEQVHKVFTTVANEIDDLILQRKEEAMPALQSRWKDPFWPLAESCKIPALSGKPHSASWKGTDTRIDAILG